MIKLSAQFLTATVIALTTAQAYGNATLSLPDIADRMDDIGKYCASAKFDVLMASHSEPVEYTVGLQCEPADGDTLSPCRYLIEWKLDTPSGEMKGFSAYFDGSHFRFRDRRLQEYHASDDSTPFAPSGAVSRGVQQQVQFADIIPAFMAQKFREMADDSTYIYTIAADTVFNGTPATVVKGVRRTGGYDGMEYTYVLDNKTMQPIHTYLETSPGGIGEQSIEVAYSPARPMLAVLDMESLIGLESDAFEKFRENTFSLDNLPGRPMPQIAAPTFTGERYVHTAGSPFPSPTLVVFLDAGIGSTPEVINEVRQGVALASRQVDVIWAFLNHRPEDVEEIISSTEPGETLLIHAGGAARDSGVGAVTPVIILVNTDGTVADIIRGYNNDLASVVIQKASTMK